MPLEGDVSPHNYTFCDFFHGSFPRAFSRLQMHAAPAWILEVINSSQQGHWTIEKRGYCSIMASRYSTVTQCCCDSYVLSHTLVTLPTVGRWLDTSSDVRGPLSRFFNLYTIHIVKTAVSCWGHPRHRHTIYTDITSGNLEGNDSEYRANP